jgi:putative pyoverdin transport system ATP-binding/permease protein
LKALAYLLRYSGRVVVLAMLIGIISGASNAGLLALIHAALDLKDRAPQMLIWSFAGLCILLPVSRIVSQLVLAYIAQKAIFDLRMRLSDQILHTPLRHLEEIGGPRLLAALTDDISAISTALIGVPILCLHTTIVLGCLIYLGWLSPIVLFSVGGFIIFGLLSYRLAVGRASRHMKLAREEQDAVFKHFRALIEGAKELRLNRERREEFFSKILRTAATTSMRHNIKATAFFTAAGGLSQFLFFLLIGLLLFALPLIRDVSVQTLTGYVVVLLYILIPLEVISSSIPNLGRANVALKKIESLGLNLKAESKAASRAELENRSGWQQLELVGAAHTYYSERDNSRFTLGPLNISFKPGELVFLIGGNGSGKTTLAKLLAGFYIPEGGEIRLDGKPITDDNRDSYRQLFSAIFSDFYLFESLLGMDPANLDAQVHKYLARLELDHKIGIEKGVISNINLSQGQRKRLALLTAYLEDRPIYIFDEWAADQDPTFKKTFYFDLLADLKARGKTVLVISHDDRYYSVADRVIKLEYGQIEYDRYVTSMVNSLASPMG